MSLFTPEDLRTALGKFMNDPDKDSLVKDELSVTNLPVYLKSRTYVPTGSKTTGPGGITIGPIYEAAGLGKTTRAAIVLFSECPATHEVPNLNPKKCPVSYKKPSSLIGSKTTQAMIDTTKIYVMLYGASLSKCDPFKDALKNDCTWSCFKAYTMRVSSNPSVSGTFDVTLLPETGFAIDAESNGCKVDPKDEKLFTEAAETALAKVFLILSEKNLLKLAQPPALAQTQTRTAAGGFERPNRVTSADGAYLESLAQLGLRSEDVHALWQRVMRNVVKQRLA